MNIKVRWWTDSHRSSVVAGQARAIPAIKKALTDNGIDLPFPTQIVLFHDQTEETDGDRGRQREGWPAGSNPPKARRVSDIEVERTAGSGAGTSGKQDRVHPRDAQQRRVMRADSD